MKNFITENTQGFTESELDEMNEKYESMISDDMDEDQKQTISEKIFNGTWPIKDEKKIDLWIVTPKYQEDDELFYFFVKPEIIEVLEEDDLKYLNVDCSFESLDGLEIISYFDGNNYKIDVVDEIEETECVIVSENTPDPAYFYERTIRIDDNEINLVLGNCSGGLTPYWTKDIA